LAEIVENYKNYAPPEFVRGSIERLLGSLSLEHVAGLESIVLTNSGAVGRGKTHRIRGRKYRRNTCGGFYHHATPRERAWIEIIVDTTVAPLPRALLLTSAVPDFLLAQTLYHEVGHHLDATVGSASRTGEAAAEDWRRRLTKIHMRRRYWYLFPLLVVLRFVFRLFGPAIDRQIDEVKRQAG
jgi:hypothetical protein